MLQRPAPVIGTILGFPVRDPYRLACNYSETPDMETEAFTWMSKAAEQGMPRAVSKLALFYYHGYGTEQDSRRAFELASLAAEGSVAESLGLLGMMYMLGDTANSIPQNHKLAYRYSSRGALLGDGLAQRTLAKLYSEGLGCDKDSKLAVYWIKKAAPATTCSNTTPSTSSGCGSGKAPLSTKTAPWGCPGSYEPPRDASQTPY